MTDQHPLTDEICNQIQDSIPKLRRDEHGHTFSHDGQRILDGMVEELSEVSNAEMRAAADWQLEKCDDELGNILHCLAIAGKITGEERIQIYVLFKEAMRPTNATNWRPTK